MYLKWLKFCGSTELISKFQLPGWLGTFQPGQKLIWKNLPSQCLRFLAFFQRFGFYGHLEASSGNVQERRPCLTFVFTFGNMFMFQFMEVPGGRPGASKHWSSKIFWNKTSFRGLGPPPLNAGQVSRKCVLGRFFFTARGEDWGTYGFFLNHVLPPRPSKSYGVGWGCGWPIRF